MEKESFSIDDILSEVKKRREENEANLRLENKDGSSDKPSADNADTDSGEFVLTGEEDEKAKTAKSEPQTEFVFEEEAVSVQETPEQFKTVEIQMAKEAETPKAEKEPEIIEVKKEEPETTEAEEVETETIEPETIETEENEEELSKAEEEVDAEPLTQTANEEAFEDDIDTAESNDKMVDLLSLAAEEDEKLAPITESEKQKFSKTKKGKATISVICVLVVLIVVAGVFGVLYANNMLNRVTNNTEEEPYEMVTYYDGMDFLQEDFPAIEELSANDIYSYREYLKQWYENGDPVTSTHVLNILLIGEDTREEEIADASRADSAIICSVNIDTGEINLTSVLRDMYVYFEVDGEGQYGKINAAASLGGMKEYINTIERYYKITINNYAVVNFASFPQIIDALGGVSIDITSSEIYEINNHPRRYGGVTITQTFDGSEGTMTLDGEQALAYCRIRKIDSDGARADRQKTVLNAIFTKMRKAGTVDIVKTVNELSAYVYTGYSKSELIEIGNKALSDGWLNYDIKTSNLPGTDNCAGGQGFSAAAGTWIWLADIPKDAYELQMRIYGKSNIVLNENRPDYIAMGR